MTASARWGAALLPVGLSACRLSRLGGCGPRAALWAVGLMVSEMLLMPSGPDFLTAPDRPCASANDMNVAFMS
jgi:hypothetical protein